MKRNALLIGGFVVAALVMIVLGTLMLSGNNLFKKQLEAMIFYQGNVSGLYVGAPVTFRGVAAGRVEDIDVEVDSKTLVARVAVKVKLQPRSLRYIDDHPDTAFNLPKLVARGLRARLVAESFVTGQKAIELDFLPKTPATLLGDGSKPEIPAVADRFGALIDQVAELPLRETVQDIRDTVTELKGTLTTVQAALSSAEGVLANTSTELAQVGAQSRLTLQAATAAIRGVQANTAATLASITQLSEASRGTVEAARSTVLAAQPELTRTLAGTRDAAEAAKLAMNRVAEMTAPNASLRGDLDAAIRDFSQAARGLRDWSELLEEKPNAIIFGNKRE